MRAGLTTSIFTLGLAFQQVAATGWTDYSSFSCPSNIKNDCDDKESKGFDWGDLSTGSFESYNGFSFSGFECANSFGKRDALTKRTFNSKCIKGTAKDDEESSPKFSCGSSKKFSIDQLDISVEFDTDLEFNYKMDDGSTCKHVSPCSAGGSSVKNTQCGGAKSVVVKLPKKNKGKSCDVGIHSVKFNCNSPTTTSTTTTSSAETTTTTTTTTSTTSTTSEAETTTTPETETTTTAAAETTTPYTTPNTVPYANTSTTAPYVAPTTSAAESYTSTTAPYVAPTTSTTSVYVAPTTPYETPTVSVPGTTAAPVESVPTTYSTPVTTVITYVSITTCDVTNAGTSGSPVVTQTTKTIQVTYTTILCEKCAMETSEVQPGPTHSAPPESPSPPAPVVPGSGGCPEVVPRCLNTWIFATECKDNADADCYCKLDGFVNNVVGCVQSWGSDDEFQQAASYFAGICAKYIPQNPAIITAIPCPLTGGYSAPAPTAGTTAGAVAPPPPNVPVTTITASVPCTVTETGSPAYTTAAVVSPGTMAYCSTVIIVPQVALIQQPQDGVILTPGVPTNVPAYTTAVVGPITKSYAPAPTGGVIPTTSPVLFQGAAASTSPVSAATLAGVIGGLLMLAFQL
ncbi:hypothetical protein FGG08_005439 [Glutinoglossum americanum]|uniref:CFEM domain-containing protein n=1 Tax=Glutinoglossum americanum TaxID=1670608 RepID=A0A9P8HUJ1_9PEZI|nr:hypothetical protein FGG08_005439 [Glutinoglossum americanum]